MGFWKTALTLPLELELKLPPPSLKILAPPVVIYKPTNLRSASINQFSKNILSITREVNYLGRINILVVLYSIYRLYTFTKIYKGMEI
jgi:hypothetical protein